MDFTRKERDQINLAWFALESVCECAGRREAADLADALKYETGSRQAGRQRVWAKALIIECYSEGRYGNTTDRRVWLYKCLQISRGIRFGYLLGCAALGNTADRMADDTHLARNVGLVVAALDACRKRKAA